MKSRSPQRVRDLAPSARNPRIATAAQLAVLERSMSAFGDLGAIVFNRRTGHLVGGHQRVKQLDPEAVVTITERMRRPTAGGTVAIGYIDHQGERWPYREVDVEEATETEMNVRANRPAGQFDDTALRDILGGLAEQDRDLSILGFSDEELRRLMAGESAVAEETATPEPPARPRSKPGTLYELGRHRLLCGDSRDTKAIAGLLAGTTAACVFTDPPYGVDYQGGAPIANDELKGNKLARFLADALGPAVRHAADTAAFYIWHASETRRDFDAALQAVGLMDRQQIVWVKPAVTLGWGDYLWAHEPCYYASKAGQSPAFYGDRTNPTAWRIAQALADGRLQTVIGPGLLVSDGQDGQLYILARAPKGKKVRHLRIEGGGQGDPAGAGAAIVLQADATTGTAWEVSRESKTQHPTQKPVALAHRALLNSTREGEWVYDPFGGSGSTLLAAEQTARCAALVELQPGYCDVIRQRYADLVGDATASPTGRLTA